MEYKIGDVVKLKHFNAIEEALNCSILESMMKFFGKEITITKIIEDVFFTEESDKYFSFTYIEGFTYIEEPLIKVATDSVTKTIEYTRESPNKSKEQNLVDGARLLMKEINSIRDELKDLNVSISTSFDGDTGHEIIHAEKIIQL